MGKKGRPAVFDWTRKATASTATGCPEYSARLEERLESALESVPAGAPSRPVDANVNGNVDVKFEAHLLECAQCRTALDDAGLAGQLIRNATGSEALPAERNPDIFTRRVMAAIRETSRLNAIGGIWRPLELLASRFALAAAVVLLALSVYLAEFAPPFHIPALNSQTEASQSDSAQAEIGADLPEPPAQPSNQDEVLTSLAERTNDF
jgi:hypothetical protein